jgi:hypothetical protein
MIGRAIDPFVKRSGRPNIRRQRNRNPKKKSESSGSEIENFRDFIKNEPQAKELIFERVDEDRDVDTLMQNEAQV